MKKLDMIDTYDTCYSKLRSCSKILAKTAQYISIESAIIARVIDKRANNSDITKPSSISMREIKTLTDQVNRYINSPQIPKPPTKWPDEKTNNDIIDNIKTMNEQKQKISQQLKKAAEILNNIVAAHNDADEIDQYTPYYQPQEASAATTLNNQPEVTEEIKLNAGNPAQIEEAQKDKQQEIIKENTHSEPNVNNDNLETIEQSKNNNNSLDASIQSGAEQEREFESVQQEITLDDLNSSDSNEIEATELNDSSANITETTDEESFEESSLSATEQPQMEDIEIQTIDELDNSQTIDNTDKKEETKKTQQAETPKTVTPNKPNDSSLDQSIKPESAQSPVAIHENVDGTEINEGSEQATESNPTELNSNNQPEIQEEVQQNKIFEPPVDNSDFYANNHSGVQESKLTPTDSVPNNNFEVQEPKIDNEDSTPSNILKHQETSQETTAKKTTQNTETEQNSSTSKTKIKNFFKTQIFEPIKLLPTKIQSFFSYLFNRNKN